LGLITHFRFYKRSKLIYCKNLGREQIETLYILIGLKGSGKTYIGKLIESRFNIPFLRVEDIFSRVKRNRNYNDADYIKEGFAEVEREIRNRFVIMDRLTIESTGLTGEFKEMLEELKKNFTVKLIKIQCDPELCLKRVRERDSKDHINVSDSDVREINEMAAKASFKYDLTIDNNSKTDEGVIKELSKIVNLY
jgi:shikimate kinase